MHTQAGKPTERQTLTTLRRRKPPPRPPDTPVTSSQERGFENMADLEYWPQPGPEPGPRALSGGLRAGVRSLHDSAALLRDGARPAEAAAGNPGQPERFVVY
jgi:hypothetical protein